MKKISLLFALVITFFTGNIGQAAGLDNLYLGARLGASFSNFDNKLNVAGRTTTLNESETNFAGGLAVGYDFNGAFGLPIRTELEFLTLTDSESNSTKFSTNQEASALFVNVFYDFETNSPFTPYIGAGAGLSFFSTDFEEDINPMLDIDVETSTNNTSFAWNVGLGVGYEVNESITLELGYRFMSLGETDDLILTGSSLDTEETFANVVHLGFRYTF